MTTEETRSALMGVVFTQGAQTRTIGPKVALPYKLGFTQWHAFFNAFDGDFREVSDHRNI